MELDYDIYSYLARGLVEGSLTLRIVKEKVAYEIIELNSINLNNKYNRIDRYKLQIVDKNGKRIQNEDDSPIIFYEDGETLLNDYTIHSLNNKKILKKKIENLKLVQVPETIKVPLDINTNKFIIIEKDTWIDITDINNLKFYSNKKYQMMFECIYEDNKTLKRV